MLTPKVPADETRRLERLRRLDVLDSSPEAALDDLVSLAAHICGVPISMISLVDEHRQWFKSRVGTELTETPRAISFCGHAINGTDVFTVPDAQQDERFADNPLVTGDPGIRFYAGTPLLTHDGLALGTLCVIDRVPRVLTDGQREALEVLGRQVMAQLDIRRHAIELAESERRLQRVFLSCPVAMAIHHWDTRVFVDVNDAFSALVGWTREEVIGRTTTELGIIDVEAASAVRTALAASEEGRSQEVTIHTRDGSERHVLLSSVRVVLGDDPCAVKTFVDITDRQLAERALRVSESRYRTLFDCAPDGIVIADAESNYLDANASICGMLGYSREEFIGLHASDIVEMDEVPEIAPALETITARNPYHREWRFRRKDGSGFHAEVIATMMPDGNLLGMIRDVSERKRSDARLRRLVESNAQGVIFWRATGEITAANDAFLRLVGYSRQELEEGAIHWAELTPPEFAPADERALEELAVKGICTPFEKAYIRKDGSRVPILLGAATFEDTPGEGVCFVVDLTERKRIEQQFVRTQRLESIGTLAGGIAHDLNNVLAPIMLSISELRESISDPDLKSLLGTLETSTVRGADLVRQVLTFARGVDGERVEVNVARVVDELVSVLQKTFPPSITVRRTMMPDLWRVTGDATQLHQVLLNLCVNARDAMAHGGTLTLRIENVVLDATYTAMSVDLTPGPHVMLEVADTGHGMPPDVLDRMFEPFFTTKPTGSGTGLGLSTTLSIVRAHGGAVHPYSEVGVGTRFRVYLPAHASESDSERVAAEQTQLPRGRGELILVIDDEEAIRSVVQRSLERFGYRVLLAKHGAEGLAIFAQHRDRIAAVLVDMAMPVLDGPATIVALKSMDPAVRIIASSGLDAHGSVAAAAGSDVRHFVPKPYTAERLLKTLQKVLHADSPASASDSTRR